jgi:hypothetical protein
MGSDTKLTVSKTGAPANQLTHDCLSEVTLLSAMIMKNVASGKCIFLGYHTCVQKMFIFNQSAKTEND